MKYKLELESENTEQDLAAVVDILLGGLERGIKIYKDTTSVNKEDTALKTFNELNKNVAGLGEKLDDFREVVTKTSPKK